MENDRRQTAGRFLGKQVQVVIDRPMGSRHPEHGFLYLVNYGYVPGISAPDGEEQDVYVLGVQGPLQETSGRCIAVILRLDDNEDKLVVSPMGERLSRERIQELTAFQERYFQTEILLENES